MGDKVNESQSFVQEDSFKDNYMQSGDISTLSSRAQKGKPPIPKVTIPYGEEEGGLKSFFERMRGKGKEESVSDAEEPKWESNPLYEGDEEDDNTFVNPLYKPPTDEELEEEEEEKRRKEEYEKRKYSYKHEADLSSVEIPAMVGELKDSKEPPKGEMSMFALVRANNDLAAMHLAFMNYSQEVIHNKREAIIGHHSNDGDYKRVIEAVQLLNSYLDSPVMSDTDEGYKGGLASVLKAYGSTKEVLNEYLEKKEKAKTPSGRQRLALVRNFSRILDIDKNNLGAIADKISLEDAKKMSNYNDIIYQGSQLLMKPSASKSEEPSEEKDKTIAETEDKQEESKAKFPGEDSIETAKVFFEEYSKRAGSVAAKFHDTLFGFFSASPIVYENGRELKGDDAFFMFLAAFCEINIFNYVAPFKIKQKATAKIDPDTLETYKKLISSSKAAETYEFVKIACSFIAGNNEYATIFSNMMRFFKAGENDDYAFGDDDDDEDK